MKLWLLCPINKDSAEWDPWYDKAFGFVVRAPNEEMARSLASKKAGDEGSVAWMDKHLSACTELLPEGTEGIVLMDFHAA